MFSASKIKDNPPDISGLSPNYANRFITFVVHWARCSESLAHKILILKSGPNYSTLEYTPSLLLKQLNKNYHLSDQSRLLSSVLLFTAHWLSSTRLAEHLLSQEYRQLSANLASWMGWGRAAGVAAGNLQECATGSERDCLFGSNLPLDLLSCGVQQWPRQRGYDGMWFVGCCNRSPNLTELFVVIGALGVVWLLGVAELASLCF